MSKKQQQKPRTITMTEETFLKLHQPPADPIPTWLRAVLPVLLSLVAHPLTEALQPLWHHV